MDTVAVRRVSIPMDGTGAERRSVLLVTGDEDLRAAAARALEAAGYDVMQAPHSGHALLRSLRARRIDILLTELAMEDSSGPALARRLRKQHPDLEAVYFARAGTRECEGILVRPFTRDDLLRSVAAVAPAALTATSTAS